MASTNSSLNKTTTLMIQVVCVIAVLAALYLSLSWLNIQISSTEMGAHSSQNLAEHQSCLQQLEAAKDVWNATIGVSRPPNCADPYSLPASTVAMSLLACIAVVVGIGLILVILGFLSSSEKK